MVEDLSGRPEAVEEAAALLESAEEALVVWAKYREGELSEAAMRQQLEALQTAIRKRLEGGQHQSNYFGSLCSELVKGIFAERPEKAN
jgi:glutamyl-tRNA reductase